jgi:hypothetical protein
MNSPYNIFIMFQLYSIELTHLQISGPIPYLPAACIVASNGVLLKVSSMSGNVYRTISVYLIAHSVCAAVL